MNTHLKMSSGQWRPFVSASMCYHLVFPVHVHSRTNNTLMITFSTQLAHYARYPLVTYGLSLWTIAKCDFDNFFMVSVLKLLKKQSRLWWFIWRCCKDTQYSPVRYYMVILFSKTETNEAKAWTLEHDTGRVWWVSWKLWQGDIKSAQSGIYIAYEMHRNFSVVFMLYSPDYLHRVWQRVSRIVFHC